MPDKLKFVATVQKQTDHTTKILLGFFMLLVAQIAVLPANARNVDEVRLAAGWINEVFLGVAASTKAIGQEYALQVSSPALTGTTVWETRAFTQGNTTAFRTWKKGSAEPISRAPFPSLYSYNGAEITPSQSTKLESFKAMVPVLRSAYRSLDFSWVYFTTADNLMLIYPYVPLKEAVDNDLPTEQVYYTSANFDQRAVGWTAPYLDLVGAGMMITASYPVYNGDDLLGVASRDITLTEMSRSVLNRLADSSNTTALLVDANGLAIASSDIALAAEIEAVNRRAGDAVLYYRSAQGLSTFENNTGQRSAQTWVNQIVERLLEVKSEDSGSLTEFEINGHAVSSAHIEHFGWFVILIGMAS